MSWPADYVELVYAGALGKIIGVYLGRLIEGWTYERISDTYGEMDDYLEASRGPPSSSPMTTSPAPSPSSAPCRTMTMIPT